MRGILLGLSSSIVVLCLFVYAWPLSSLDRALYDRAARWLWSNGPASDEIVIAAIDSDSLETVGAWPWPRARHGDAIERLARDGAKAIYFDVGIFAPDVDNAESDRRLFDAVAEAGNVVCPMTFEEIEESGRERIVPLEPLPELAAGASGIAHVHLAFDDDDVVRTAHLAYTTDERTYWGPSVELVRRYFGLPPSAITSRGTNLVRIGEIDIPVRDPSTSAPRAENGPRAELEMNVAFFGGRDAFPTTSVSALLERRVPPGTFDGKIVIYGATAEVFGDGFETPMSRVDLMPGIVIQAHATATILERRFVREAGLGLVASVTLLIAMGWGWVSARWAHCSFGWSVLALLVALVLAPFLLMGAFQLRLMVTPVAAALMLTYVATVVVAARRIPEEAERFGTATR